MIPKEHDWGEMPYPTYGYKKFVATFGSYFDFKDQLPKTQNYDPTKSLKYNVLDILQNNLQDDFILNKSLRNIVNNLINKGFINTMFKKGSSILSYELSNKTSFCFPEDVNDEKKFSFGQLVGKLLDRNWHFAFSGFPDLNHNVFVS
ncbi:MAG TPA: hypothetical protein VMV74_12330 [Bacteroidales bacterium]|nr:hypothetical protein [Bacteroidales bacterium]